MKNFLLVLTHLIALGLGFLLFSLNEQKGSDTVQIKREIHYVINKRIEQREIYKKKYIQTVQETDKKLEAIENAFEAGRIDSAFNVEIPPVPGDTAAFRIFQTQGKACLEYKAKFLRDSSNLALQNENVANCDEAIDSLQKKADSIPNVKKKFSYLEIGSITIAVIMTIVAVLK